jgi:5-methylcytosine-specific restriction endonuclease McrA
MAAAQLRWRGSDMARAKVKLTTVEHQRAFGCGRKAAQAGHSLRNNPYRPCSDGDLWRAWNKGFADRGESKEARARRNRAEAVVAMHGNTCWLCHRPIDGELTMDHVIPRSKGGRTIRDNLRPAHGKCNRRRGNGPPPELLLREDMALPSPRSKPIGGNPPQSGVPCEARERDQRQTVSA